MFCFVPFCFSSVFWYPIILCSKFCLRTRLILLSRSILKLNLHWLLEGFCCRSIRVDMTCGGSKKWLFATKDTSEIWSDILFTNWPTHECVLCKTCVFTWLIILVLSKLWLIFLFATTEASGQNFREEEVEEKGCNSEVSRKRRREANYDDSSLNDQVNYRKITHTKQLYVC